MTQERDKNIERKTPLWLSDCGEWKIIPVALILIGVERMCTGTNLLVRSEPFFATPLLIFGIIASALGVGLLFSAQDKS